MKYLLCFLFPPAAVLLTGRPLSALINFLLSLCLWFPGVIHALIVVGNYNAEVRHAETLSAMTGQPVKVRKPGEWVLITGVAMLVGFVFVVGLIASAFLPPPADETVTAKNETRDEDLQDLQNTKTVPVLIPETVPVNQQIKDNSALLAMQGKTLAEIEGTRGKALAKDSATGWAEWPKFRARFVSGKVAEVQVK